MNILCLLPVNDTHRALLESSVFGADFTYTSVGTGKNTKENEV